MSGGKEGANLGEGTVGATLGSVPLREGWVDLESCSFMHVLIHRYMHMRIQIHTLAHIRTSVFVYGPTPLPPTIILERMFGVGVCL